MDIKQKINDAKLLIKNDRRVWAVAGGVLLVLMLVMSSGNKRRMPPRQAQEQLAASQMTDQSEAYKDLVRSMQSDIATIAQRTTEMRESQDKTHRALETHKREAEGIFQMFADRLEGLAEDVRRTEMLATQQPVAAEQQLAQLDVPEMEEITTVGTFGFEENTIPPPPPPAPIPPARSSFISPGDTAPVHLLTGVAAPTDGTPYPVVFKLKGPISGPDGSSLDLGEARIVAAAQGSETDGRVIYRLTDLALRHRDGRRSVVKVDGWVVGEDGIRGMKGRVIDKLGQLIAATAGYSFVAALGERIDRQANRMNITDSSNVTIAPNDLNVAGYSALTDSSNRLGQLLIDKYEKQIPVVEVNAGRDGAAIFARGAEVAMLEDDNFEDIYDISMD